MIHEINSMIGPSRPRYPYVDIHEDCDLGIFCLLPFAKMVKGNSGHGKSKGKYVMQPNIRVSRAIKLDRSTGKGFTSIVFAYGENDFPELHIRLNTRRVLTCLVVHDLDFAEVNFNEIYGIATLLHDLTDRNSGAVGHYFPKYIVGDDTASDVYSRIDRFLETDYPGMLTDEVSSFAESFKGRKYGHLLYNILIYKQKLYGMDAYKINLRLMLLFLTKLAYAETDNERIDLLDLFCGWIVHSKCSSCTERLLIHDILTSDQLYDIACFSNEEKVLQIERCRVRYATNVCGTLSSNVFAIHRLEHSEFTISAIRDIASIVFRLDGGIMTYEIPVRQCIALRNVLDIIARSARAWFYGHDNKLFAWIKEMYLRTNSFEIIDMYICEFILSWDHIVCMRNCLKNLVRILYFGKIPPHVLMCLRDAKAYDVVVKSLIEMRCIDTSGVITYLFDASLGTRDIMNFLADPNRISTLKGLCGIV